MLKQHAASCRHCQGARFVQVKHQGHTQRVPCIHCSGSGQKTLQTK
jgi:DnaJ-class molecular chaperone